MNSSDTANTNEIFERLNGLAMIPAEGTGEAPGPKPQWLKTAKTHGDGLFDIKRRLRKGHLFTVCEEAKCPNISECLNAGTSTFMLLGDTCTRGCRFCNVKTGNPKGTVDDQEGIHTASTIRALELDYVVLTMVDRDDLDDGGAGHVADCVAAIRQENPNVMVEILAGDFRGQQSSIAKILEAGGGLNTFAHNLETVRRCTPKVRDARASYNQSLEVLRVAKELRPKTYTKSGIMLGLGETLPEIEETLRDLRRVGTEIVTIGQYLQPTPRHLPVQRYAHPDEFAHWHAFALSIGFLAAASGPLVRSSYRAAHLFPRANPARG